MELHTLISDKICIIDISRQLTNDMVKIIDREISTNLGM